MADYSKNTNFTAKDVLATGDPNKRILGSLFDSEFDEIQISLASKLETGDFADNATALAGSSDTTIITPAKLAYVLDNSIHTSTNAGPISCPVSGFSDVSNVRIWSTVLGALVVLYIEQTTGTSNTSQFIFQLPAQLRPVNLPAVVAIPVRIAKDNGVYVRAQAILVNDGQVQIQKEDGTAWTTSGVKGFAASFFIAYTLNTGF